MANEVYANGREISCKSGDGKVIAAFPDVCFTPPENPATPPGVPVPYPISSFSSHSTEGTKNVKINNKEVMIKNISCFKKCMGDEAGAAAKKGMITSSNTSKTFFKSWSMDVKFEGQNVVRHFDLTTSNHRSDPGNEAVPFPEIESMALGMADDPEKCAQTYVKFQLHRHGDRNCRGSRQQSHHPAMNACFQHVRGQQSYGRTQRYRSRNCPAVCIKNSRKNTPHYKISQSQKNWVKGLTKNPTYADLRAREKQNLIKHAPMEEHEAECIMLAVDAYMETIGVHSGTVLRKPPV